MLSRFVSLFFTLLAGLLLAGCPQQPDPNPGDTMLGGGGGQNPNFVPTPPPSIGEMQGDAFPDEGLFPQDDMLADGTRLEDILPSVFFDYDQSFIREDQRSYLTQAYEYLENNPEADLLIEGHCDFKGTREYNLALGDRRANSVRTFLVQLGIAEDRIETLSKGDLEALEDATDDQRAQDRRADLIVIR